jgi:halocyanin-like protein
MDDARICRRRLLATLGSVGTAGVAGCSLTSPDDESTDQTSDSTSANQTATETETDQDGETTDDADSTERLPAGEEYWSFETGGFVGSSPTVVDGTLYVGSEDRHLYALDAETGEEQWRFRVGENPNRIGRGMKGAGIRSSPQVVDGSVYFGANDYKIYALDAATGEKQWDIAADSFVFGSPVLADGILYSGTRGQTLYALDPETGESIWESYVGISGVSPIVIDGKVYTGSYSLDRTVSCFDAASGDLLWTKGRGFETCSSPTFHDGKIMLGSLDKNVYALNAETGDLEWSCEVAGIQNMASFTAKNGTLYATQYSDGMAAIDIETGEELWRADTSSSGNQAPTIVGDTIVVVSQDSILSAVDAESGEIREQVMIHDLSEAGMVSSPIVVDGVVFLGTEQDHSVHAVHLDLSGSSEGSRVEQGMLNHHHSWAGEPAQELEMQRTGDLTAENIEEIQVDFEADANAPYHGWMQDVPNYDATVDYTDASEVRIEVGAGDSGHLFESAAVLIEPGTEVVWEWTGRGGSHNVVVKNGDYASELTDEAGYTVSKTFNEPEIVKYFCEPHRAAEMKGIVSVGEVVDDLVEPEA